MNVGISVQGNTIAFSTRILIIEKNICVESRILRGKSSSMAPISFEKRFRTRPIKQITVSTINVS